MTIYSKIKNNLIFLRNKAEVWYQKKPSKDAIYIMEMCDEIGIKVTEMNKNYEILLAANVMKDWNQVVALQETLNYKEILIKELSAEVLSLRKENENLINNAVL